MIIILAEKPDMARKIMSSLTDNCQKFDGYYSNKDYIFTYALGHLTTLVMPDKLNCIYVNWGDISQIPFHFENIPLMIKDDAKDQFHNIKTLLYKFPNAELVNACDADAEGELIFRNILQVSGAKPKNITRMWINSATPEGIKQAFDQRKPSYLYDNIGKRAKGRSYGDYLIGLNASRIASYYFTQAKMKLSVGRVQTPTLKMIVDRENEIANFSSVEHFNLYAIVQNNGNSYKFKYLNKDKSYFDSHEELVKFARSVGIGTADVIKNELENFKEDPPMLFSLSDLQIEMNKRHGMTAQEVLNICQTLYEKYNLTTYPRTDETRVSEEFALLAKKKIKNLSIFKDAINEIVANDWSISNKVLMDGGDVGSHEALSPTFISDEEILPKLNQKERTVYEAITKRFIVAFFPSAEGQKQKVVISKNDAEFSWSSKVYTNKSFLKILDPEINDEDKNEDIEPDAEITLNVVDGKVQITDLQAKKIKPKPPAHFSEATLIASMKNPSKYLDEEEDKKLIKKVEGIGTEATRAGIIENLKKIQFIEVKGKKILPTQKGISLINSIPNNCMIKSVKMTAQFESKLAEIEKGNYTVEEFLNDCKESSINFKNECSKVVAKSENFINQKVICKCPVCGGNICDTKFSYRCNKCDAKISKDRFKEYGKDNITIKEAKELFTAGKTKEPCKLTFKKNKEPVECYLVYEHLPDSQYSNSLKFEFIKKKKSR